MAFKLPSVNTGALRAQLDTAKTGYSPDSKPRVKVENNQIIYFFILPPWNAARGMYAKETVECFNLPPPPGKKFSHYVAWQTYEYLEPGISAKDPVTRVLREVKDLMGQEFPYRLNPNRKFTLNIILRSYGKLGEKGEIIPESYVQPDAPKVATLGVTPPAFTKIAQILSAAMEAPEGRADNPLSAVCFCLSKIEKPAAGGGKAKTEYVVGVEGRTVAGRGLVPDRFNLTELYKTDVVEGIYSSVEDLDAAFPVPTESQRVEAEHWASIIRAELTKNLGGSANHSVRYNQPPQVAQRPPVPPTEFATPRQEAPPVAAPAVEAPPASAAPAHSSKDVMTRDLGLDSAPRKEGGIPICFAHIDDVAKSPNSRWCATCAYRNPCKAKQATTVKKVVNPE